MVRHLHFSREEFATRQAAASAELTARGLDALLMFRQESMFYLTGFDTFGYVYFQCMILTADGRTALLTRAPDKRQAAFTSTLEPDAIHVWADHAEADPVSDLKALLADLGLFAKTLGVEWDAYGLTAAAGQKLSAGLHGFAKLEDASDIVSRLRLVKSDAEIAYVRRAAELADDALEAAKQRAAPGVSEADILADMHTAVFRGGGDDPANEFIIGSGPGAMMCRYYSGRRTLSAQDQLTLEFAGTYRHYHSCLMRTFAVGEAPARQRELHSAATDALLACEAALKPGRTAG
ncbi:MAG: Xaa-Pro peptidase family protein, partial [Pseudomonadota bacterium]